MGDINQIISMAEGTTETPGTMAEGLVPRDKVGSKIEARSVRKNAANKRARSGVEERKMKIQTKETGDPRDIKAVAKKARVVLPKRPNEDFEEEEEDESEGVDVQEVGEKSVTLTPEDLMPTKTKEIKSDKIKNKGDLYPTEYVIKYNEYAEPEEPVKKIKKKKWYNSRIFHVSVIVLVVVMVFMVFFIMYKLIFKKIMNMHNDVMRYPPSTPAQSTQPTQQAPQVQYQNPADNIPQRYLKEITDTNNETVLFGGKDNKQPQRLRDSKGRFVKSK